MQRWRDELFIRTPITTHDTCYVVVLNRVPELSPSVGIVRLKLVMLKNVSKLAANIQLLVYFIEGIFKNVFFASALNFSNDYPA